MNESALEGEESGEELSEIGSEVAPEDGEERDEEGYDGKEKRSVLARTMTPRRKKRWKRKERFWKQ